MPTPALSLDLRPSDAPLLVGVSGGMDSAVLLGALVRQGTSVEAAHVHYGLRGADSDADAALVARTCAALGVKLHTHRVAPEAAPPSNRQAWARGVRYRFFAEVAVRRGLHAVAVAHHADDQAETVLLALLRGGTLAALRGMRPRRDLDPARAPGVALVRPLLHLPRAALRAYAEAHGTAWRDDASNADRRYRRSAVRHDLLPRLDALAPGTSARLAAAADVADRLVERDRLRRDALLAAALSDDGGVRLAALAGRDAADRALVWTAALRRFLPSAPPERGRRAALDGLVEAQVGRRIVWPEGTVWRERDALRFVPAVPGETAAIGGAVETRRFAYRPYGYLSRSGTCGWLRLLTASLLRPTHVLAFGAHTFAADAVMPCPADVPRDPCVAFLRADAFPLAVRAWRPGERLRALGTDTAPRVSGLLTRARVPASERERWPVVARFADGAAVWVPGVRLGADAAARPGEASVRVVFSPAPSAAGPYL